MKGVLYNVVEAAVVEMYDEATWDALLEAAGLSGAYTSLGNYPDGDLTALVSAACAATGLTEDDVVRAVGRVGFADLSTRSPEFVAGCDGLRAFLPTIDEIIHPEVLKLYPGATVPRFVFREITAREFELDYHSERGLCVLAEGLLLGAADHFGERATVGQSSCKRRGDDECCLVVLLDG